MAGPHIIATRYPDCRPIDPGGCPSPSCFMAGPLFLLLLPLTLLLAVVLISDGASDGSISVVSVAVTASVGGGDVGGASDGSVSVVSVAVTAAVGRGG